MFVLAYKAEQITSPAIINLSSATNYIRFNETLNNASQSIWDETFFGNEDKTFWITIPKNAKVTNAYLNLSGYTKFEPVLDKLTFPEGWNVLHGMTSDGEYLWIYSYDDRKIYKINISKLWEIEPTDLWCEEGGIWWLISQGHRMCTKENGCILEGFNFSNDAVDLGFDGEYLWVYDPVEGRVYKINQTKGLIDGYCNSTNNCILTNLSGFYSTTSYIGGIDVGDGFLWTLEENDTLGSVVVNKRNLTTGELIKNFTVPSEFYHGLEYIDGYVWFGIRTHGVIKLDTTNGEIIYEIPWDVASGWGGAFWKGYIVGGKGSVTGHGCEWDQFSISYLDIQKPFLDSADSEMREEYSFSQAYDHNWGGMTFNGTYIAIFELESESKDLHFYDLNGNHVQEIVDFCPQSGYFKCAGLAWDGENYWVSSGMGSEACDENGWTNISKIDPSGNYVDSFRTENNVIITGLTWYNNYLYAFDDCNNKIFKINVTQALEGGYMENGSEVVIQFDADLVNPWGFEYDGKFFYCTYSLGGTQQIRKVNSTGQTIFVYDTYSRGLAFDNQGYLWSYDFDADKFRKINVTAWEWSLSGEFNQTNSPQQVDLNSTLINNYLSTCTPDSNGNCDVPFKLHSDTAGKIQVSDINITYDYNISTLFSVTSDPSLGRWGKVITPTSNKASNDLTISGFYVQQDTLATNCYVNGVEYPITTDANGNKYCPVSFTVYKGNYFPEYNITLGSPKWSDNSTSIPTIYNPTTPSIFNITWDDVPGYSIDTVYIEINHTGTFVNYTMNLINPYISESENKGIYSWNATLPAGYFCWRSYANASDGVLNSTPQWCFTINKNTSSCNVLFNTTSPQTYPTAFRVWSDCDTNFTLYRNGTVIANNSIQILAAGVYNFTVIRKDTQNYTNYYDEEIYTINKGPTKIILYLNGTSSDRSYVYGELINITAVINVSSLQVCLDLNATGFGNNFQCGTGSVTNITNSSVLGLGYYNVTAHFDGNENYSSSYDTHFISVVDVGYPTYSNPKTSPTSPTTYSKGQTYQFNITWTDDVGIDTVIFEWNGTNTTVTTHVGNEYYYTLPHDLKAGTYTYKWYANDTSNNWNTYSDTYIVNKATPSISSWINGTAENKSFLIGSAINLSASVSPNILKINISMNLPNWIEPSGIGYIENITVLPSELKAINFTAYTDGNENYTSTSKSLYILLYNQSKINVESTYALVRTIWHEQNITGYYNLTVNNTLNIPLTVELSATLDELWANTSTLNPTISVSPNSFNWTRVNITLDGVYEYDYIPTWETSVGGNIQHTYIGKIIVRENKTVKTLPIKYKIPKSRLPEWDSRLTSPAAYSTINGSSQGVSIIGEEETGFITVKVNTTYSTSSLSQGVWYWSLIYYTKGAAPTGGGGGGYVPVSINYEVYPEELTVKSVPNFNKTVKINFVNLEAKNVIVKFSLIKGKEELWLTDEIQRTVEAKKSVAIPLYFRMPSVIGEEDLIIRLTVQMGTNIVKKDIKVKLISVEGLEIGEKCDADEECLSNNCLKLPGEEYATCKPPEVRPPTPYPPYIYIVIIVILLVIIFFITRKRF